MLNKGASCMGMVRLRGTQKEPSCRQRRKSSEVLVESTVIATTLHGCVV